MMFVDGIKIYCFMENKPDYLEIIFHVFIANILNNLARKREQETNLFIILFISFIFN